MKMRVRFLSWFTVAVAFLLHLDSRPLRAQPPHVGEKDFQYIGPRILSSSTIAVSPSDTSVVYLGTYYAESNDPNWKGQLERKAPLFKSKDGGKTWSRLPFPVLDYSKAQTERLVTFGIDSIIVDPANPAVVFIITRGSKSDPQFDQLSTINMSYTNDGGQSWLRLLSSERYSLSDIRLFKSFLSPDSTFVYLGEAGNFFNGEILHKVTIKNRGVSSQTLVPASKKWDFIKLFFPNPANRRHLVLILWDRLSGETQFRPKIYFTDNEGKDWTRSERGLPLDSVRDLYQDPSNPAAFWVQTGDGGLYKSTDETLTWLVSDTTPVIPRAEEKKTLSLPPLKNSGSPNNRSLQIGGEGLASVAVSEMEIIGEKGDTIIAVCGRYGYISLTNDGGKTWSHYECKLAESGRAPDFVYIDGRRGFWAINLYEGAGFLQSDSIEKMGQWPGRSSGFLDPWSPRELVVDPQNSSVMYIIATDEKSSRIRNTIMKKISGGGWTEITAVTAMNLEEIRNLIIDPYDPKRLYALGIQRKTTDRFMVLSSTSAGATWSQGRLPAETQSGPLRLTQCLIFSPADSSLIYTTDSAADSSWIYASQGNDKIVLFRSKNRGESWQKIGTTDFEIIKTLSPHPADPNTFFIGTANNGIVRFTMPPFVAPTAPNSDFNGDGVVGFDDFFLFAAAFGSTNAQFDLNADGKVDFGDFFIFAENFGKRI